MGMWRLQLLQQANRIITRLAHPLTKKKKRDIKTQEHKPAAAAQKGLLELEFAIDLDCKL